MYQILQDALPYLFAFYLIDGLIAAEAGQLLFIRTWRTYRARRGGLHLAAPWPTSEAVRAYDPPLFVASSGFYVARAGADFPVPRGEDLAFHAFESGARVARDGRKVVYGKKVVLKAPSETAAAHAAGLLRATSEAAPEQRLSAFERWLNVAGDLGKVRERTERYRDGRRRRQIVAALLFTALFAVIPALLILGPEAAGYGLELTGLAILALHTMAVIDTRRTLRRAMHIAPGSPLASMALFPPNAMHAPMVVTKDLYGDFHPMAVAAALLPAEAFYELARRERHRLEVVQAAFEGSDTAEYWRLRLEAVDRIATAAKADAKSLGAAPARVDDAAAAYCPLCFTEYRRGFDACADCGTALRAFAGG